MALYSSLLEHAQANSAKGKKKEVWNREFIFPWRKKVGSIRQNKKCRQMGSKLMFRFIVAW